jgi:hypothetical protein
MPGRILAISLGVLVCLIAFRPPPANAASEGLEMTFHKVAGTVDGRKLEVFEGVFRVRHRLHVIREVTAHGLPETVRSELAKFSSSLRVPSGVPLRR